MNYAAENARLKRKQWNPGRMSLVVFCMARGWATKLAKALGTTQAEVSRWMHPKGRVPSPARQGRIAKFISENQ